MDLKGNKVRRRGLDASGSEQGPLAGCCAQWTFGLYKRRGISWPDEWLL